MSIRKSTPIRRLLRAGLVSLNNLWIWKSVIVLIPTISAFALAFPAIQEFFTTKGQEKVRLNTWGVLLIIIAAICYVLEVLSNMISSHDSRDKLSYEAEIQIRRNASINEALYEEEKNRDLRGGYRQIAYNNNNLIDFIIHYVNPRERTNKILTQISKCIAGECEVDSNEIVLSSVVCIDDGEWAWLCYPEFEGRAHLKELLRKDSALKQVIDDRTYFYKNEKKDAISENKYISDRRDKTNDNVGSIICWEVATIIECNNSNETHSLRMIVNISTYGKLLVDSKLGEEKINDIYNEVFEKMILNQFKGELTENLIWYGLQKLS